MNATRSSPDRSALSSCASAVSVCATNRRDTADLLVLLACSVSCSPTGSSPAGAYRRVDSPASIFSIANRPSSSVVMNSS